MVEITDVEDVKISNVKLATHPNPAHLFANLEWGERNCGGVLKKIVCSTRDKPLLPHPTQVSLTSFRFG